MSSMMNSRAAGSEGSLIGVHGIDWNCPLFQSSCLFLFSHFVMFMYRFYDFIVVTFFLLLINHGMLTPYLMDNFNRMRNVTSDIQLNKGSNIQMIITKPSILLCLLLWTYRLAIILIGDDFGRSNEKGRNLRNFSYK